MQTVRGKSTHATNIVRHKMTHTGEKRHQCKLCGKCFSTPGNAYRHIRNVHKKNPKLANLGKGFSGINFKHWDQGQRKGKVKKERYGASTNHDSQRKGTRRTKQSFVCGQCGKLCRDSYDLKLQCTLCNKCFSSRYRLVRRTMTHAGEKRFDCVHCHKWFPSKSELERHNRTHTGEKPFKCQHCDKCFSVESNRRRHEKIHSDGMPLINNQKPFKFKHCGKRFSDSPSRRRHEKTHSEGLNNTCSKHNIDVNGADGQQQKMRRQKRSIVKGDFSTTQGFACKHCRKRFPNQFRLIRHTRTHTGEKPFACERCGKLFSDSANLRRHEKTHGEKISVKSNPHDNMRVSGAGKQVEKMRRGKGKVPENRSKKRRFQCGHCGKCFPSLFNLERHTRTHTGEKAHGKRISVKSNRHDNMRVSGAGKQEEKMRRGKGKVPENRSKKRRFQCGHCGKCFPSPFNLQRHTRTHTREKPFACERCGKLFSDSANLRRHEKAHGERISVKSNPHDNMRVSGAGKQEEKMRRGKGKVPENRSKKRRFQCGHCGKCFPSPFNLERHTRTHTGEKPFACERCGKLFSDSGNMRRHEKTHGEKISVKSNSHDNLRVSGAGKQQEKMRRGKRKVPENVSKKRRFQCGHCGKRFLLPYDLKRHTRTHTGEKPFKCEHCGKRFNRLGSLRRHEKTHKVGSPKNDQHNTWVERLFQCEHCGKRFSSKCHLNRHNRTHRGEKPLKGQDCDKWSSTSGNRKRHEQIHSAGMLVEKQEPRRSRHACWICAEEFRSELILRKHYDEHMSELCDVEQ